MNTDQPSTKPTLEKWVPVEIAHLQEKVAATMTKARQTVKALEVEAAAEVAADEEKSRTLRKKMRDLEVGLKGAERNLGRTRMEVEKMVVERVEKAKEEVEEEIDKGLAEMRRRMNEQEVEQRAIRKMAMQESRRLTRELQDWRVALLVKQVDVEAAKVAKECTEADVGTRV